MEGTNHDCENSIQRTQQPNHLITEVQKREWMKRHKVSSINTNVSKSSLQKFIKSEGEKMKNSLVKESVHVQNKTQSLSIGKEISPNTSKRNFSVSDHGKNKKIKNSPDLNHFTHVKVMVDNVPVRDNQSFDSQEEIFHSNTIANDPLLHSNESEIDHPQLSKNDVVSVKLNSHSSSDKRNINHKDVLPTTLVSSNTFIQPLADLYSVTPQLISSAQCHPELPISVKQCPATAPPNMQIHPLQNVNNDIPMFCQSSTVPMPTEYTSLYHNFVTPQYPILSLPDYSNCTSEILSIETDPESFQCNSLRYKDTGHQSTTESTTSNRKDPVITSNSIPENKRKFMHKNSPLENNTLYRERKERPIVPKCHVGPEYFLQLIEKVNDLEKVKSISKIVREVIRILPLKRDASISWVDKETIFHALDEMTVFFENHFKFQVRHCVLKDGFQAISPNFVPDTNNTRCEIDDDNFAIQYKQSLGFVKESSKISEIDIDTKNAQRLSDGEYYSCWINKNYSKNICMQRLAVESRNRKGDPILFKGFKWGHQKLEADIETSFIIHPEYKLVFYQWLSKSIGYRVPKKNYNKSKKGDPDYLVMKVNLTKPSSGLIGLPKTLCELEFWEFNGTNIEYSISSKYPGGMKKITAFLAEDHTLQPFMFNQNRNSRSEVEFDND